MQTIQGLGTILLVSPIQAQSLPITTGAATTPSREEISAPAPEPSADQAPTPTASTIPTATVAPAPTVSVAPTTVGTAQAASPVKIITPIADGILDIPAATVILQYRAGATIQLTVNGALVDNTLIGRTETDSKTGLITQTWYGVSLTPGENHIVAQNNDGIPMLLKSWCVVFPPRFSSPP